MSELPRDMSQVRQQLKQVLFRHLQKQLRANFRKAPDTCRFNRDFTIKGAGKVFGCVVPAHSPSHVLCDERVRACEEQARQCPLWEPRRKKEQIKTEFRELVMSGDRGQLAARYPDVTALLWVLGHLDQPIDLAPDLDQIESEVQKALEGEQEAKPE